MKYRHGHVSNSSSSSFICKVCGDIQSGMDMCLEEAYMYECKADHTICEDCVKEGADELDSRYEIDKKYCPICLLESLDSHEGYQYLIKKYDLTNDSVLADIKSEFGSYKKFDEYITKK